MEWKKGKKEKQQFSTIKNTSLFKIHPSYQQPNQLPKKVGTL